MPKIFKWCKKHSNYAYMIPSREANGGQGKVSMYESISGNKLIN